MTQLQKVPSGNQSLTMLDVVQSKSPIVAYMRKDESLRVDFLDSVYFQTLNFLLLMDTDEQKAKLIAKAFAEDVLEKWDTWKAEDIPVFFKTIRQSQDKPEYKVFGNKITILKLNEWAGEYEADKCDAMVQARKQPERLAIGTGVSEKSQQWAKEITDRLDKKRQPSEDPIAEIKGRETENALKLAELWDKVQKGQLSEEQYLVEYNQFLQR